MNQDYLNKQQAEAMLFAARAADWRNGAIIYQVIVDRFAESANLNEKMHYYTHPRQLRKWSETPTPGKFLPTEHVWSHEIDFWGGDLKSLGSRMDYLKDLEIDVLYLNPIQAASTNHKYDATDYMQISPEYGTRADLIDLINTVHKSNLKIVLDGVFNHMGRQSDILQQASSSRDNP
jgi:glycosidase